MAGCDEPQQLPPPPEALRHLLVDSHAHPADDPCTFDEAASPAVLRDKLRRCRVGTVVAMSTSQRDLPIVRGLAEAEEAKPSKRDGATADAERAPEVVACFGIHPWFTHAISLSASPPQDKSEHYRHVFAGQREAEAELAEILDELPPPVSLQAVIAALRNDLEAHPGAMLGEVGIDRAFRIPRKRWSYDPANGNASGSAAATRNAQPGSSQAGGCGCSSSDVAQGRNGAEEDGEARSKPKLTRLKTPLDHQLAVLKAQIALAVELGRNVSFHSVQASGATVDLVKQLHMLHPGGFQTGVRDINLSFHSCTMDPNIVRTLQKTYPNVFIGFSTTINKIKANHRDIIRAADADRLLVESDFHEVDGMAARLWEAVRVVGEVWSGLGEDEVQSKKQQRCDDDDGQADSRERGVEGELDRIWRKGAERLAENWRRFRRNGAVQRQEGETSGEDSEDDAPRP
ncbi:Cut9-interacting protein scn1 [Thecaphora frezii]